MAEEEKKEQETQVEESTVDQLLGMLESEEQKGALQEFITRIGKEHEVFRVTGALVDSYIAEVDKVISEQMDAIIHNEEFQKLESTWRGLHFLVQNTQFTKPVKLEVLDVSKPELADDLEEMLRHLSVLSEMAQLPFVANASSKFFGSENYGEVMNNRFLGDIINEDAKYTAWRSFREDDRSKYIGLTLPRFLSRLPYGKETDPTKNFNYTETTVQEGEDKSPWVNASFALASNMVRSFEEWGWSVKIVGVDSGGRVANLPTPTYEEHGQTKIKVPVEASVGQAKDQELCDLGFIPLAHWDRTDYACFFEVPSTQRPKEIKNDPEATANYSVGARLQYTMLVTRIAHFLKYRQLRFVGKNAGAGDIEKSLSEWLDTLVSDFPNPAESVVAERPLRSYQLEVHELPERPGFFQIVAEFRPHVAIVGMDIKLRLVAYHSGEE
jgi:type VI secretion system protein ImpC